MGIYVGQPEKSVDSSWVYYPDTHQILERGSVHKLEVDESQILQYYQRRKDMREIPLSGSALLDEMEKLYFDFEASPSVDRQSTQGRLRVHLFDEQPDV
jgi:hypothetical protein